MEKSVKIVLFFILALLVVNFVLTFFSNNTISKLRKNLETAKLSTDSALQQIRVSQSKLDSIKSDMVNFRSRMTSIQQNVEGNDIQKKAKEEKDLVKLSGLKNTIEELKPDLEPMNLPDIDIRNLEK